MRGPRFTDLAFPLSALHRAAYAELGLTGWTYDRFDVTEGELADFVAGCNDNWRGLSLTMPLKSAALELGDVDSLARFAGSANTLIFDGLRRRLYNTDIGGLVARSAAERRIPLRVTIWGQGRRTFGGFVGGATGCPQSHDHGATPSKPSSSKL